MSDIIRWLARRWGQLSAERRHGGADLLIAATALERGLTALHDSQPLPLMSVLQAQARGAEG